MDVENANIALKILFNLEGIIKMQTKNEYFEENKEELGEILFQTIFHIVDNDYYMLIEKEIKDGKTISQYVYDSLSEDQKFHFNKHYNYRGDKVELK